MSEISFPNEHTYNSERAAIDFPALVDGKPVECSITLDEMMREFGCGNPGTFENSFRRLRPQIEERAKRQLETAS
jgi:hypothetical protein